MRFTVAILFVCTLSVRAQDVLTLGSGSAASGGIVSLPVTIRDTTATPLGTDAGAGNRIQGFAFKILYPAESIATVSFARAGITASLTPLFETTLQGEGWIAYVVSFDDVIAFTPDGPGDQIGTLTATLDAVPTGTVVELRLDPPSAILSNQPASVLETVANGELALVDGTVTSILGVPSNVVATAANVSQVNVSWNGVANADYYEVWRSVDNGAFAIVGSPVATLFTDMTVAAGKTYLYRVRAVETPSVFSSFSGIDAATTIVFTDDPLVAQSTVVKALHLTQLRTAINAFRVSAGLATLPPDGTVIAGAVVLADHVTDLRTALDEARSAAGVSTLSYTDATLTTIKAVHVTELRNGVK